MHFLSENEPGFCGHSNHWNSNCLKGCQLEFSVTIAKPKQSKVPWNCKCKWNDDFVKCSSIQSYTDLSLTSETESDTQKGRVSKRKPGINWQSTHQIEMPDPVKFAALVFALYAVYIYTNKCTFEDDPETSTIFFCYQTLQLYLIFLPLSTYHQICLQINHFIIGFVTSDPSQAFSARRVRMTEWG